MHQLSFLLLLFYVPDMALSSEVNESKIEDAAAIQYEVKEEFDQNKILTTLTENDTLDIQNKTLVSFSSPSFRILSKQQTHELCKIYWQNSQTTAKPADSDHIWVSWDVRLSLSCSPHQKVIIKVDGDEKTIYLTSDHQNVAFVKAEPCLKHKISLRQFNNFTESRVTNYDIKSYFSDSWSLRASLSERMCLNKDNMTVNILEPIEQFRSCIVTRGKQKVDKLKYHGNVISGEVTLALKDSANKTSDQPDQNNIIIPVNGVKMCTENYEGNNTHLTQIENSQGERGSSAKIAVSLTIMTLIVVSLIAGFIFWKKQKQIITWRAAAVRGGIRDSSSCMEIDFYLCKIRFKTHVIII